MLQPQLQASIVVSIVLMMYQRIACLLALQLVPALPQLHAQATSGHITGTVKMKQQVVGAAVIRLSDVTNGMVLQSRTNAAGMFQFNHVPPGNHWKLVCTTPRADTLEIADIQVQLNQTLQINIALHALTASLQPVLVRSRAQQPNDRYTITAENLWKLPATGNNLQDWLMTLPQAYTNNKSNGAISFSGQNNRYNALYIDGALQNDVFGLSPTGTYGGQTNSSPVAAETIEQLQLQLSPYDASLGDYTGAAIHVVTKSGKNHSGASMYHYTTQHKGAEQNTGFTLSGPIQVNRSFYYFNTDYRTAARRDPYPFESYAGETRNEDRMKRFVQSLITRYGYDPGQPDAVEEQRAGKLALRIDRLLNTKDLLTFSIRQQFSERVITGKSSPLLLLFSNNGKHHRSGSFSGTLSLNSRKNQYSGNELVLGYTWSKDDTEPLGKPFPSLRILDGEGMLFLGSNEDAQQNSTIQSSWTLRIKRYFNKGQHQLNWGMEAGMNRFQNQFLQNKYGAYFYYSITDFLQQRAPVAYSNNYYRRSFPFKNNTSGNIESGLYSMALFVNDRIRIGKHCVVQAGVRITAQKIGGTPGADSITSNKVIPAVQSYYDLAHTRYGGTPALLPGIAPRLSILLHSRQQHWQLEAGTGVFNGRMPMAWLSSIFSNNGLVYEHFEAGREQRKQIRFSADAQHPWTPEQTGGIAGKGVLNLVAGKLSMPSVWRTTVQWTRYWSDRSSLQLECMYYVNRKEIHFSNVNLLPLTTRLSGPDNRMVYRSGSGAYIPVEADSSNPYQQIILFRNNPDEHGYGYGMGISFRKNYVNTGIALGYSFNDAYSVYDGNYSVLLNQWQLNEAVNGRNEVRRSRSDFSAGHRIYARVAQEWMLLQPSLKINLSISYQGGSGTTYSYVYGKNSLTRDDPASTGYDLIYIPTTKELKEQTFLPLTTEHYYYTAEQQQEALEWYIQQNSYLNQRRGKYAARNGSRTPFVHYIHLKLTTSVLVKLNHKKYGLSMTLSVQNLGNLLNRNWGKQYYVPGNRIRLINFAGFVQELPPIPAFRFDPELIMERGVRDAPGKLFANGSEWLLELGFRIHFINSFNKTSPSGGKNKDSSTY